VIDLVRRWAVDWLACANPGVCEEILAPEYAVVIGDHRLGPREAYVEAALEQLRRFPGLGWTVHELIATRGRAAVRLTAHGASKGRPAAWRCVAVFRGDAERLSACFAEEDYAARRRQLDSGVCDAIEPPAVAPWSTEPLERDAGAEAVVREWLGAEPDELFSAGPRVAFHAAHVAGLVTVADGRLLDLRAVRT
jgi:hypothetical protein